MKLPWFNKLTTSGFFHCPFVLSLSKDERTPFSHTLLANQGSPAASIIETRRLRSRQADYKTFHLGLAAASAIRRSTIHSRTDSAR